MEDFENILKVLTELVERAETTEDAERFSKLILKVLDDSDGSFSSGIEEDLSSELDEVLQKHYYGEIGSGPGRMDVRGYGPLGAKNPKKSPHSSKARQKTHARGSGNRVLTELVFAYKRLFPEHEIEGSWNDTINMEHEDLVEFARDLGILVETRGGTLTVVDQKKDGFKVRAQDISGYVSGAERGQGKTLNEKQAEAMVLHALKENGRLTESGKLKPYDSDKQRLGRFNDDVGGPEGKESYGSYDPNKTLDKQPVLNRYLHTVQRISQKLQNEAKRKESPKLQIDTVVRRYADDVEDKKNPDNVVPFPKKPKSKVPAAAAASRASVPNEEKPPKEKPPKQTSQSRMDEIVSINNVTEALIGSSLKDKLKVFDEYSRGEGIKPSKRVIVLRNLRHQIISEHEGSIVANQKYLATRTKRLRAQYRKDQAKKREQVSRLKEIARLNNKKT